MSEKVSKTKEVEITSEVISLEDYITKVKPHPGLVASFKVENASDLTERSEEEWTEAFKAQSNKVYR